MEFNKETLKEARRVPTPATRRAVLAALDVLDMQPVHKPFSLPRWAVATAAAATMVTLVATVPPLRHRTVGLALDVLGRAIPQTDRVNPAAGGVAPLPSAQSAAHIDSVFLRYVDRDPIYTQVAQYAQVVGAAQTVNGITVTVEEATVTNNRLFLELCFENLPEHCFPAEEILSATVTGEACSLDSQKIDMGDRYAAALPVSANFDEHTASVPVDVAFSLSQFPDNGQGKGEKLADFKLSFETKPAMVVYVDDQKKGPWLVPIGIDAPASTALTSPQPTPTAAVTQTPSATDLSQATAMAMPATTTAAAEATAMPGNELPTPRPSSKPETTALPSSAPQATASAVIIPSMTWSPPAQGSANTEALLPSEVELPEIAGTTYHEAAQFNTGIILEMPDTLMEWDSKAWMNAGMAKNTDLLCGWKGDTGSLYMCVGEYGIQNDLWKAANYVANQWSGEVNGQLYAVGGQQVVLLEDAKGQLACIVLLPCDVPYKMNIPAEIVNVNGDTVTIWGTPAYIHHALKTMRFDSSAVKWISKS